MNVKLKIAASQDEDGQYAILPKQAHNGDAFDLYAATRNGLLINPHEKCKISTGICMEIPEDYWGLVALRSGIGFDTPLAMNSSIGVIDPSYRGPVRLSLVNNSNKQISIEVDKAIAQLILVPRVNVDLEVVDYSQLSITERGVNGFGSTSQKNSITYIKNIKPKQEEKPVIEIKKKSKRN